MRPWEGSGSALRTGMPGENWQEKTYLYIKMNNYKGYVGANKIESHYGEYEIKTAICRKGEKCIWDA